MRIVVSAVALVLLLSGCGGGSKSGSGSNSSNSGCTPGSPTPSAGNAQLSARALGGTGYNHVVVVKATDKRTGKPVPGATVLAQATMTCPHLMQLAQKDLPEASGGTYRGEYNLIMQGEWTINIILTSKKLGSTTSAIPVTVKIGS